MAYGTATLVGTLGTGIIDASGLAWDGTDLYMVDRETDALYTVNKATGAAARVEPSTTRFGLDLRSNLSPTDLAWVGSTLYVGVVEGSTSGTLYTLDTTTGILFGIVGSLGIDNPTGLAWDSASSILYAVDDGTDALFEGLPSFAPDAGDLYYNGAAFADALLRWDYPLWAHDDADCVADVIDCSTYEHDLKLEWNNTGGWFSVHQVDVPGIGLLPGREVAGVGIPYGLDRPEGLFYTTWSDLPDPYDDCPTAGILADPNLVELSFGTFKAPDIC